MHSYKKPTKRMAVDPCCSIGFLTQALYVFNTFFWVTGIALLLVGLWSYLYHLQYTNLLITPAPQLCTYLMLATGSLVLVTGLLGCFATLYHNRAGLLLYAFILMLIFLSELGTGLLAYLYHSVVVHEVQANFNHTLHHQHSSHAAVVDQIQLDLQCCGLNNHLDWVHGMPDSCCISPGPGCGLREPHPNNIHYFKGCSSYLLDNMQFHLVIMGGIALGFSGLQLIGILLACCLARKHSAQ